MAVEISNETMALSMALDQARRDFSPQRVDGMSMADIFDLAVEFRRKTLAMPTVIESDIGQEALNIYTEMTVNPKRHDAFLTGWKKAEEIGVAPEVKNS